MSQLPTFGIGYNLTTSTGALPLVVSPAPGIPSVAALALVFRDEWLRTCEWLRSSQYEGSRQRGEHAVSFLIEYSVEYPKSTANWIFNRYFTGRIQTMTDFSKSPTQPMVKPVPVDPNMEPPVPSRGHVAWLSGDRELIHNGGLLFVVNINNVTNGHGLRIGGRCECIDSPKWRERVVENFGRHPTLSEPDQVPEGSDVGNALEKRDVDDE